MKTSELINIVQRATGNRATISDAPNGADLDVWETLSKSKPKRDEDGNITKPSKPIPNRENLSIILEHDPTFESLKYMINSDKMLYQGQMIEDHTQEDIALDLEIRYRYTTSDQKLRAGIQRVCRQREVDPIRDYLMSLTYEPCRAGLVENLFVDHFQCQQGSNGPLLREIAKRWAISCVARALEPGCKMDTCLVLVGPKGIGKSTALATLCGHQWFSDSDLSIDHKDGKELIHQSGVWIWELSEMHSLHGKSADNAKQFLASQVDRYRPSYGKYPVERQRRIIFTATTNEWQFLSDGPERRFWPIVCNQEIDLTRLGADRDAIWAEAVWLYQQGERWWLDTTPEHDYPQQLEEYQQIHRIDDPWVQVIQDFMLTSQGPTTRDIMQKLELQAAQQHTGNSRRIAKLMRDLGYKQRRQENKRIWTI